MNNKTEKKNKLYKLKLIYILILNRNIKIYMIKLAQIN